MTCPENLRASVQSADKMLPRYFGTGLANFGNRDL